MAHGDAREGKWRGTGGVGSQYSSHYLGTWCIEHYYRRCAHLGCPQSTELRPPVGLNGLVRFAERQNLVSARVPSHFKCSLPSVRSRSSPHRPKTNLVFCRHENLARRGFYGGRIYAIGLVFWHMKPIWLVVTADEGSKILWHAANTLPVNMGSVIFTNVAVTSSKTTFFRDATVLLSSQNPLRRGQRCAFACQIRR